MNTGNGAAAPAVAAAGSAAAPSRGHRSLADRDAEARLARRVFSAAVGWLLLAAILGVVLRGWPLFPLGGLAPANLLHAHTHVALLGWVGQALFALAIALFLPAGDVPGWRRLFWTLQLGVAGMAVTFLFGGYGPGSIAFCTLHLMASVWWAAKLWTAPTPVPVVRTSLRVAVGWLLIGGLGPLALGPLAAAGLRGEPAYQLALYFFLHALANGWITFFLLAAALRGVARTRLPAAAERAMPWLVVGSVLTFAQSTLWLDPPAAVRFVAGLGGGAQLAGGLYLAAAAWRERTRWWPRPSAERWLVATAGGAWLLKLTLQWIAALPSLAPWVEHRFVIVAFLHLFFLGTVTPALFVAGSLRGWWIRPRWAAGSAGVFLFGVVASEGLLVGSALGLIRDGVTWWLWLSTFPLVAGVAGAFAAAWRGFWDGPDGIGPHGFRRS
jgi:hypothetical protein